MPIDPHSATGEPGADTGKHDDLAALSLHSLARLFETLPEAVVVADRDLHINAAAEALFGHTLNALQGRKTETLYADWADFLNLGKERYNPNANPVFQHIGCYTGALTAPRFWGKRRPGGWTNTQGETQGYLALIRPVHSAEQSVDTLQRLHSITADAGLDHNARLASLLPLGARHFGLDLAILSSIDGDVCRVEHCHDRGGNLSPGVSPVAFLN